jgi:uncharacterized delta-60 repeat protein
MKKFSLLVVLFLTIFSSSAQTAALDPTFNPIDLGFENGDGANNDVNCLSVQTDGKILIAGSFTSYNGISRNSITRLNADGSQDSSFDVVTGANNSINSLAIQSDGKIIIGGIFTSFDGISINRIARLNTDGSLDTSFNAGSGASAVIYSVTVQSDDKILIGGNFTTYNGVARARIARLNADGSLDTSFTIGAGFNSFVNSIALQSDGKILVGGNFTTYNGTSRPRIIRLESSGVLDTSFTVSSGANGIVNSIVVLSDGKIIVGGNFTSYNGISANRIIRLNTNGSLDTGFSVGTGADDAVFSLKVQSDGSIVIGGSFTEIDGVSRNRMARLNVDGSLDAGFVVGTGADSQVRAIAQQSDGKILIGGYFTAYNNNSKNFLARLETNGTIDSGFAMGTGANNEVFALAIQTDGKILIGGAFTSYNNISSNYIARLNIDGSLDSTFNVGIGANNTVYSVAVQSDGKILIGGYFTAFNGVSINNMARLNPDGSLDSTFDTGTGANGIVYSIAIQQGGKIVIGGEFTTFDENSMNYIARLNTDGSLDTSFDIGTGADSYIYALKVQMDNKILIGGGFTSYNDIPKNFMARLNSDGSFDIDFNVASGTDSDVTIIDVQSNGKILIGGYFTNYDDASRNHVARLNTNGSLDTDFVVGSAANTEVFSLTLQEDNKVIIGGSFTSYNGIPVNRLARLNTDGSLDTNFTVGSGANGQINNLLIQPNGKILMGGQLTGYNSIGRNRISRINGFTNPPIALSQTFCGAAYVENLVASGINLKWYSTALAVNALTQTDIVSMGTYYVSQTVNTIESERVPVSIIVSSNEVPVFTQVEPIAQGAIISPLTTTSNNGIQGNWTPALNTLQTTTYTFTSTDGCETSTTMTIVVNSSAPVFTPVEPICSGETLNTLPTLSNNDIEGTWSPALNNLATTTYTFTPNAEGISSVTMTIIVNPSTINTTTVSSCVSYTWGNNGQTYTTSGTYIGITTNCITEQLVLTINNSSSNINTITACETFTWEAPLGNGLTYTNHQTGILHVSTNEVGCPHTQTLNLTITPRPDAPIIACYQTAIFNTATCQWDIEGTRPAQPTELACYQTVGGFNTTTCQWDILGEQPEQPLQVYCWDDFVFDTENCIWSNTGIQPQAPLANSNQTFKPGATVALLVANGNGLKWYNQAIGGSVLQSNTILTRGIYYVSQTINGCESERVSVEVTLIAVLCSGATVSDLVVSGGINVRWFTFLTSTTALSSTSLLSTRIYYFTQTIEGNQTTKVPVSVTINLVSNATSISGASGTICPNSGKTLSLNATSVRGTIQWQSSGSLTGPFTPISGATATTLNTGDLLATTFYNAVVTNGVCLSGRTATVTINVRPQSLAGTITGGGDSVCSGTNSTVLMLSGQLGSIQWYSSTNNIDFFSLAPYGKSVSYTAKNLAITTYYKAVLTNGTGCTAASSASVVVNVKPVTNAGVVSGNSIIPFNTRATLEVTGYDAGATLQWKYGGTPTGIYYNGGQVINTSTTYTTGNLIRDVYFKVVVTKDGCSRDTAPFLVDVSSIAKLEDGNSSSDETQFNVIAYPNPSSSEFTIETSSKGDTNVQVYDMQGRLIERTDTNKVGSRLAAGVYNVIVNQGTKVKTLRVIKR